MAGGAESDSDVPITTQPGAEGEKAEAASSSPPSRPAVIVLPPPVIVLQDASPVVASTDDASKTHYGSVGVS